ncbi:hypothetical protein HPB52_022859 [Rhipicephalus sanguineus]|uniref:BEN domain-containing protein n=1 Tax=Rhipicephalus sanguineus TaxID=34632 RepID=A0A9D4YR10_RHISA|nr:hypothetical protein HPB52_022859 [Rhipicephalus sanguineus]
MYASVRFRDDDVKAVVSVADIKHFSPNSVSDYDSSKWYRVRWQDDHQKGFFRAQIVRLFETKEAASQSSKRVPLPPRPSDSEEETDNSVSESSGDSLHEVLNRNCQEEVQQLRKENRLLKAENEKLLHENKKMHSRLEILEKALCSSVFDTESRLWAHTARCSTGAVASQASPMEPQKYQKLAAVTSPSSVPKMCKDTPDLSAETADLPSNLSQDEEVAMQPRCTAVSILGDKVLLGSSVFFTHYLEKRCSDSELTKRHNMLGKLVAAKIADLMKQKK